MREAWTTESSRYVRLYSYAAREERVYRVEGDVAYHPQQEGSRNTYEIAHFDETSDDETTPEPARKGRAEPAWIIVTIALAMLILTLVASGVSTIRSSTMSYETFLSTEMSLPQLVATVSARVSYDRDIEDYWTPAADLWESRHGDCEDYALLVSVYLTRHDIEHDLVSFSLEDDLAGHAAVIAHVDGARVLIDPTMATAPGGIEYFHADNGDAPPSAAEVLDEYAVLPATIYETPPRAGQPVVGGYIE